MKVYEYNRVLTSSQDVAQQHNRVAEFVKSKGWTITESIIDEGVAGSVSYKERNLYKLIQRMAEGEVLVVSEVSCLSSSISDLNKLVNDELKKRGLRLVVVKMELELDCSNVKAMDEKILFALGFCAQIEKEMRQERTRSALDVRKQKLAQDGSFVSKKGNVCTGLGRPKGCEASEKAVKAATESRLMAGRTNPHNIAFQKYLAIFEERNGPVKTRRDVNALVQELCALGYKSSSGLEMNVSRAWNMIYWVRKQNAS